METIWTILVVVGVILFITWVVLGICIPFMLYSIMRSNKRMADIIESQKTY